MTSKALETELFEGPQNGATAAVVLIRVREFALARRREQLHGTLHRGSQAFRPFAPRDLASDQHVLEVYAHDERDHGAEDEEGDVERVTRPATTVC